MVEGLSISRQRVILPSIEACKNCGNFDPNFPCPQLRRHSLCTSFEIIDAGDPIAYDEEPAVVDESVDYVLPE